MQAAEGLYTPPSAQPQPSPPFADRSHWRVRWEQDKDAHGLLVIIANSKAGEKHKKGINHKAKTH